TEWLAMPPERSPLACHSRQKPTASPLGWLRTSPAYRLVPVLSYLGPPWGLPDELRNNTETVEY
ncbi:MAG: hypothetical protein ABJA60_06850, partial [Nitrosospira sp.]